MWVRSSAIRPVAPFARVPAASLEAVRQGLASDDDDTANQLDLAFDRFEREQPCLSAHIGDVLSGPLDETALALGYFLALAVWLAFDRAHPGRVDQVSPESVRATHELLILDEELRRMDATEALDSEDVIGMEQPDLIEFVHEHVSATMEANRATIDVDDVDVIYRIILVEILSLSYAVARPAGFPAQLVEIHA